MSNNLKTTTHYSIPNDHIMSGATAFATQSQATGLSSLITALDNTKLMRVGENGHSEYDWNSNDLQEQLVQLSFQTVRTQDFATRYELTTRFQTWVTSVLTPAFFSGQNDCGEAQQKSNRLRGSIVSVHFDQYSNMKR